MNARFAALTLGLAATLVAAQFPPAAGDEPTKAAGTPEIGQEAPPDRESDFIEELRQLQLFAMKKTAEANPKVAGTRGQHPKQHGCVLATFTVRDGLPDALRRGLFAEPKSYRAVIRFSNGATFDDSKPDAHGMAIKLVGVEGPKALGDDHDGKTQDFILMDSPVFFARNVENLVGLFKAGLAAKAQPPDIGPLSKFAAEHPDEFRLSKETTSKRPASPFQIQYFSTTPYKLGDGAAVKYTARPSNYLREAMVARLTEAKGPVVFEFCVQRQVDPVKQPIEDPTVPWDTPEEPVATITIEPQSFASPEQLQFCENLTFDPWHALAEHGPLGGINRARRPIYPASSALRHKIRQDTGREPSGQGEPTEADLDQFRRLGAAGQGR